MKRNPNLSTQCLHSTGHVMTMAFNRHTIGSVFVKLKELLDEYKFESHEIWNFDVIGTLIYIFNLNFAFIIFFLCQLFL